MGEEQDGSGNEIQIIGLPTQRRNDDIKMRERDFEFLSLHRAF